MTRSSDADKQVKYRRLANILGVVPDQVWRDAGSFPAEIGGLMSFLIKEADALEPCTAVVHHGPGHQSTTLCQLKGPHDVHLVWPPSNGCWEWRGAEVTTDYFDELPILED